MASSQDVTFAAIGSVSEGMFALLRELEQAGQLERAASERVLNAMLVEFDNSGVPAEFTKGIKDAVTVRFHRNVGPPTQR